MIPILFDKSDTNFLTRGLYSLPDAIACKVAEARNGEYELELSYPINGEYFDEITEDRIIVAVPFYGGSKQAFRIYRREADLDGVVVFRARHISYQLNFIPVDLVSGSTNSAQTMMEDIGGAALDTNPFAFESDILKTSAIPWAVNAPCGLRSALGGQEGSVLDKFGGEFEWDNWTVILHEARGVDNNVFITYGKNLTELSDTLDIGETITGVMAFYQYDNAGATATIYTSPKVIETNSNPYAHKRIVPLDCSAEFDSVPTQLDLTAYAEAWLRKTSSVDPVSEITLSFVPLSQTTDYTYDAEIDMVRLCDTVHIRYPALGLSVSKKVTKCVWDVLGEKYDEITLGEETSLADTILNLESNAGDSGGSSGGLDLLAVYPIGSIYMSVSSVHPEILFGGQWSKLEGVFLLAAGGERPLGSSGGEATHTLTAAQLPKIQGSIYAGSGNDGNTGGGFGGFRSGSGVFSTRSANRQYARAKAANAELWSSGVYGKSHIDMSFGEGKAHNNMPPYLAVNVWKRIG